MFSSIKKKKNLECTVFVLFKIVKKKKKSDKKRKEKRNEEKLGFHTLCGRDNKLNQPTTEYCTQ